MVQVGGIRHSRELQPIAERSEGSFERRQAWVGPVALQAGDGGLMRSRPAGKLGLGDAEVAPRRPDELGSLNNEYEI